MSSRVELKELGSLFLGFGGLVYVSCNCLQDFGPLAGRLKKFPNFQTPDSDSVTFPGQVSCRDTYGRIKEFRSVFLVLGGWYICLVTVFKILGRWGAD